MINVGGGLGFGLNGGVERLGGLGSVSSLEGSGPDGGEAAGEGSLLGLGCGLGGLDGLLLSLLPFSNGKGGGEWGKLGLQSGQEGLGTGEVGIGLGLLAGADGLSELGGLVSVISGLLSGGKGTI